MLEFLSGLNNIQVLLIIIFVLFVFSIKKVLSVALNSLWIAAAAVLAPIILNRIFSLPMAIDTDSLIFYMMLGLGAYMIYLLGKAVYILLGMAEKFGKDVTAPVRKSMEKRHEKLGKKVDEYMPKKKKKEE